MSQERKFARSLTGLGSAAKVRESVSVAVRETSSLVSLTADVGTARLASAWLIRYRWANNMNHTRVIVGVHLSRPSNSGCGRIGYQCHG